MPYLIEPKDLLPKLDDQNLIIIDLSSFENYAKGHLKGAIWLDYKQTFADNEVHGLLPSTNKLKQLFGALGHNPNKTYIVYDDEGGGWAGRFIWLLDSISHPHYLYLNGGRVAWQAEGLPLVTDIPLVNALSVEITPNYAPTAYSSYIADNLNNPNVVFWDARSADEYNGIKVLAKKGGHIQGAINLEWTACMEQATKKIRPDLLDILQEKGISKNKEVITYCQAHHRSGFTYLAAKILGFEQIKAYAGGWLQWGNL